jgi:hypothetical protein
MPKTPHRRKVRQGNKAVIAARLRRSSRVRQITPPASRAADACPMTANARHPRRRLTVAMAVRRQTAAMAAPRPVLLPDRRRMASRANIRPARRRPRVKGMVDRLPREVMAAHHRRAAARNRPPSPSRILYQGRSPPQSPAGFFLFQIRRKFMSSGSVTGVSRDKAEDEFGTSIRYRPCADATHRAP